MGNLRCKRIYHGYSNEDGIRILVDRLWPRGISKENAKLDYWLKEVAPSNELRKWYHHDLDKFEEFKSRYIAELSLGLQLESLDNLKEIVRNSEQNVTLLFGAKDEEHNQAVVLKSILMEG